MAKMASKTLNLPGGEPLKRAVIQAVKTIDRPCDSKEITTQVLQLPKGTRGWYESHARIRYVLDHLVAKGNLALATRSPNTFVFVRDLDCNDRERTYSTNVKTGKHTLYGMSISVNKTGAITAVHTQGKTIMRESYSSSSGRHLEAVDIKGMPFQFVRNKLHTKAWVVKDGEGD